MNSIRFALTTCVPATTLNNRQRHIDCSRETTIQSVTCVSDRPSFDNQRGLGSEPETMSPGTQTVSRYRMLRGKSVSEARKTDNRVIDRQDGDNPPLPVRTSMHGSPPWRKRSKTHVNMETEHVVSDSKHFPVPAIPTPPDSLKEHTDTAQSRAVVVPFPLNFGDPSSPTPLGKRKSSKSLSSPFASLPKISATKVDASRDVKQGESNGGEQGSQPPGFDDNAHQRVEDDDPERLAQRLHAETDRIEAEQKRLAIARLHQQLVTTNPLATVATPSRLKTPTKNPVLERLGFSRTRKSQVPLSPASSGTASIDFAKLQVTEPFLSPTTVVDRSPQFTTPPLTPLSPMNNDRVSRNKSLHRILLPNRASIRASLSVTEASTCIYRSRTILVL